MPELHKYRIYCNTETAWVSENIWRESAPTQCPNNAGHEIDTSKTTIIGTEGAGNPTAEDGKEYVSPDLFPLGYFMVHAGRADDVPNGTIWGGDRFKVARTTVGVTDVEFQFIEHVLLAGGAVTRLNGKIDDYIDMTLYAPATAGTSNPGAGAYDKYSVGGGLNLYIPNATAEGDWDLNLTEKLNANVNFTKAVPVPASKVDGAYTGWFDYDLGSHILAFNSGQTGAYNLFDGVVNLSKHVVANPLLGEGKGCTIVPAVKPAMVLPHWKFKVSITEGGSDHDLDAVWKLIIGRKSTT